MDLISSRDQSFLGPSLMLLSASIAAADDDAVVADGDTNVE